MKTIRVNYFYLKMVLYMNYLIHGMGLIIMTQSMRALADSWQTPLATVSYVISGVGIGRLLAYYVLGTLSDKYGRKTFVAAGMISYGLFFIGMALVTDFRVAYFLAIVAGIANSALDAGTYPTFLELKGEGGSANILIKAAMSVGEFILPILIAFNEQIHGWYGLVFLFAGALVLLNLLLLGRLRFPERLVPGQADAGAAAGTGKMPPAKIGLFIILSLYGYCSMAMMILFTQWITLFAINVLHMNNFSAHVLLSLYSVGSITGVLLIFLLLHRIVDEMRLVAILNGLSFLILLMIGFSGSPLLATLGSFLFGITAAGGVMQVGLNVFGKLFPEKKGRITGIYFSFGSIASFTIPIMTGALSQYSFAAVLRADAVIALVSFILCAAGHRLMRAAGDRQPVSLR